MDRFVLLDAAADSLREYGFRVETREADEEHDGTLTLEKDGRQRTLLVEIKMPLTVAATLGRRPEQELIYVTDRVSTRTADGLRRLGAQFVDADGNAHIRIDDWYVDVRGKRRKNAGPPNTRPAVTTNLYTAKRAQVVFVLLCWPHLIDAPVRTIADAAGVSIGIAQSTTHELRRRALWPNDPGARGALIDGWAAAFPGTLARSLTIRVLHAENLDRFFGDVMVSGETAHSAHMRPVSGVVYVDEMTTELLMQNRWRSDGAPNLVVRRRFWNVPGEPVRGEAPRLLVYGDLLASDDPRTRSVAARYRLDL